MALDREGMVTKLREVLGDTVGTKNWTDDQLTLYLAEGQDKFCEDTGYFTDSTTYTITLDSGVSDYALSDRVIQVLKVKSGTRTLSHLQIDETYYDESIDITPESSAPVAWRTDETTGYITIYPTPSDNEDGDVLTMKVWRYSLYDLAGNGAVPEHGETPLAEPELPPRFRWACIEWAAFKALSNHDEELQDKIKAADHLSNYRQYVRDGQFALRRVQNVETRIGTNPAYRTE